MKSFLRLIIGYVPVVRDIYRTRGTAGPITLSILLYQKLLGINRDAYWPVHFTSRVTGAKNIKIGIGTAPGLSLGCYIQGIGKIHIGDYTLIGPNVGIISANHDCYNSNKHQPSVVRIGNYCWIGMNSVILPGVELGDHTTVAAGSVVTQSFPEGYSVLGGVPARVLKELDKARCVEMKNQYEYYGYIPKSKFDQFRKKNLSV